MVWPTGANELAKPAPAGISRSSAEVRFFRFLPLTDASACTHDSNFGNLDMTLPRLSVDCTAAVIARFLKERGVTRVFALCGGHIMPIWMRLGDVPASVETFGAALAALSR